MRAYIKANPEKKDEPESHKGKGKHHKPVDDYIDPYGPGGDKTSTFDTKPPPKPKKPTKNDAPPNNKMSNKKHIFAVAGKGAPGPGVKSLLKMQ